MVKTRQLLWISLICSILAVQAALAQSSLTQIQDTVNNSDGTPFNGTVVITWNGYAGANGGGAPLSTSARVYNGALSVLLVPTTTASSSTFYQVVYYGTNGVIAWTETWQVPPSSTPLTISAVRTSSTSGGSTGGGTTTGGGGTTTGGGVTLPISMTQVTGLSTTLAALNSAIAALSAQLTSFMATATPGTNAAFVDAETPSGTLNGSNTSFNLSQTPLSGLSVFRNGLLQSVGVDYTVSGTTIAFMPANPPKSTDTLSAFYRISGIGPTAKFVDSETPGGAIDGVNVTFTLASTPNPPLSLKLYKNGILMTQNADYSLNGSTIVFTSNAMPVPGDSIVAAYRY